MLYSDTDPTYIVIFQKMASTHSEESDFTQTASFIGKDTFTGEVNEG